MAGDATGLRWIPRPSSTEGIVADFYSDTKSKPTPAMLQALVDAEVGDEQKGEDPATNELCRRVAELTGKEAAVLLPTGTMCNEIALRVHCEAGSEVICERSCHIVNFEAGGPAALSGVMIHPIDGEHGRFTADQVRDAVRTPSRYAPESRLVAVEQTTNMGGGGIWPLDQLREVAAEAKSHGLKTHMDGARVFNASVKAGVRVRDYAEMYDSVWIDLTKGLGGFAGAVLAGSEDFVNSAWRLKQQWGGGLRQSGYIAATGLYALDHHVERLADDHALAALIGERLEAMASVRRVLPVETNIVIFEIAESGPTAAELVDRLLHKGVCAGVFGERTVRIVSHLGVDQAGADLLCDTLREAL
ncbi:MAG: threonine aldolase family protein [Alphaproteobacteria bacterium]|nr:threonine aldolase family protein [Alphaproteobacteria bacterium]